MLLTLLFKQNLQRSREFREREREKDERQEKILDPLSLITSNGFACAGVKKKKPGTRKHYHQPFPIIKR